MYKSNFQESLAILLIISGPVFLFTSSCNSAPAERPPKSSIQFGAPHKPEISGVNKEVLQFASAFANVAEQVSPSVVSVVPSKIDTVLFRKNPFYRFFNEPDQGNDFFQFFFGRPPSEEPEGPEVERRERRSQGLGSGVIVSENGYVLTNYHVVTGADEIEVRLKDGRSYKADIVGIDSLSDVAVLKITDKTEKLPVAYLGDSDKLRPGDWTVAIGNPFSLSWTVTVGIVSALGRSVGTGANTYEDYIQTDAAINPGNSGGALANLDGEVIGINTMIYTSSGGNMGIGFAIPINLARRIMEDLIYDGEVTRGWIGVTIQPLDEPTRTALGIGKPGGVLIGDLVKGQPADRAGLQRGDIVVSIENRAVNDPNELRNIVAALEPGKRAQFIIIRDGRTRTLNVTPIKRSEEVISEANRNDDKSPPRTRPAESGQHLGITVENLTDEVRYRFGIGSGTQGVAVTEVSSSSGAFGQLQAGDVIEAVKLVNQKMKSVSTVEDISHILANVKNGDTVMLSITREGQKSFIAFKSK